jgi:integrase
MLVLLTDRFCDRVKATAQTDYFDEKVPGLALRVTKHGVKAWTFLYKSSGRKRRITLGRYPTVSLADARARAVQAKSDLASGADPRGPGAMTVADLVESYIAKRARDLRSGAETARRLRKDVAGVIGNVRLSELHRRDATRVLDAIVARGATSQTSLIFDNLRTMLRWAVARGDLDHNPIDGMERPSSPPPRERVLTDDEIRTLWTHPDLPHPRILRLCLLTAQRIGEVVGMTSAELDLDARLWLIPGSRTKNGHPHAVPLTDDALAEVGDPKGAVFPNVGPKTVAHAIARHRLGLAHWTAHDLRRTALTGMAKLGVAPIVLGHIANHRTTTKAGMTLSVYVQHAYGKEMREALELWADRLQGIVGGGANVVALRGGAE